MQDFKAERTKIEEVKMQLEQIQNTLDETYEKAVKLQDLMDAGGWRGEAFEVGMAFLDLTIQYHEKLSGGGEGPTKQAYDDLEKYLKADSEFYGNWERYQELLGI